ncbi:c-type cytochrome [bacterium]|nr:c-type cytochrome [bacterium]
MKSQDKRDYLKRYKEQKKNGIPFWPNALFKDAIVALIVLIALIVLSYFVGAELDERANPSDDGFSPKPEWYFLFLFQLLKYFPGSLEFVGVLVLPSLAIAALFLLPWLDRSEKRHITKRPYVLVFSVFMIVGVVWLSLQSVLEEPAPTQLATGDPVASLYVENCAGCHSEMISVPEGTDLIAIISQGGHAGMPAWNADLSADEIDALAGFVLSPRGNQVFGSSCADCHDASGLAASDPFTLRDALDDGGDFEAHADLELELPSGQEATALVNFLIAPDGHRLFALNCSSCHGSAVPFDGTAEELREVIRTGGGHQDMPAMGGILDETQVSALASYSVDPATAPSEAAGLFGQYCSICHGDLVPQAADLAAATEVIVTGGAHEDMPVWGEILTEEQLDALAAYAFESIEGSPAEEGRSLYAANCSFCHGDFGEGGVNPANPAITLSPISTAGYLGTRDDTTLRAIINQGQPDFGMSPFGLTYGGPLGEDEVGSIVAFLRSWQADPPVELPPEVEQAPRLGDADEVFTEFCSQCHGVEGEGGIGPSFQANEFHDSRTDEELFTSIDLGHAATAMIAWGQVLTNDQIVDLVAFIRDLRGEPDETPPVVGEVSFSGDVAPVLEALCLACHNDGGAIGGWSASSYESVIGSGDSGPAIDMADLAGSTLIDRLLGTSGALMPPQGMPQSDVDKLIAWIEAGALDN